MTNATREIAETSQKFSAFCYPNTHTKLQQSDKGLLGDDGVLFPFLNNRVVDFISPYSATSYDEANLEMYNAPASTEIYRNFLDWLFLSFNETEEEFRIKILKHLNLSKGDKVLITSVGLGDDISIIQKIIGSTGEIHAQDISKSMVLLAEQKNTDDNVIFSISNGNSLPYVDNYFDSVFHFGGINLFGDTRKAIAELTRVCKIGGRVVFGDESIAPHLRGTEYAKVAINNNKLWEVETPLNLLPYNANDIQLNYILGNCFYVISFTNDNGFPYMNIDIEHKGLRGGSARTRYYGQIEGVTEVTKKKLIDKARESKTSVHNLLETIINKHFN